MAIRTNTYVLHERDVRAIVEREAWRMENFFIAGVFLLFSLFIVLSSGQPVCLVAAAVCMVMLGVFRSESTSNQQLKYCRENGMFTSPHWLEISSQFLTLHDIDGTFVRVELQESFKKMERFPKFYTLLMKTNRKSFFIIPREAFESEAQCRQFEAIVSNRGIPVIHHK